MPLVEPEGESLQAVEEIIGEIANHALPGDGPAPGESDMENAVEGKDDEAGDGGDKDGVGSGAEPGAVESGLERAGKLVFFESMTHQDFEWPGLEGGHGGPPTNETEEERRAKDPPTDETEEERRAKDPSTDETEEERRAEDPPTDERLSAMSQFALKCRLNVRVQRRVDTKDALAAACVTSDYDTQHSAGISTASRTDFLLASFETTTGFMKAMNALELWSIVRKVDVISLVVPWSQDQLKQWSIVDTKGFPLVDDLTPATKTKENDTGRLKALWDNRHKTRCLLDPQLREAAAKAPRCTYKHFLTILNEGRQLYSDFAHALPLLSKHLLKNMMVKEFSSCTGGKDFHEKWDKFKARETNRLRSAASRKKKEKVQEEAKEVEEEAEELQESITDLEKQLEESLAANPGNVVAKTRRGKQSYTPEQADLVKKIKALKNKTSKKRKCTEKKAEEAAALAKEEKDAADAAQELEDEDEDEPSSKKRKKNKPICTLIDLTFDLEDGVAAAAPVRDTERANTTAYRSPVKSWQQEACHIATLLMQCRLFVNLVVVRDLMEIDLEEIQDANELTFSEMMNAQSETVAKTLEKKAKKNEVFTADSVKEIFAKYASNGEDYKEERMLTFFVRRAFVRLALVNVEEFCKGTSKQPLMGKAQAKNIVCSLKSWMPDYTDRKLLYSMLQTVEYLQQRGTVAQFKKLVKGPHFNCLEKDTVARMIDLITKKGGIERKSYHTKQAKKQQRQLKPQK